MSSFNEAYQKLLSLSNLQTKQYTDSKEELKKSLIRTKRLLASLGNPEKELQFVHVGGTSGKGSVANYIQTALQKSGHSAGVYTSPHTTSYIERFRMGNRLINPARLARHINDITGAYEKLLEAGESPLSFFELSTVIAIYAAKQESMEWCVLEVGCGGRYDATNVIPGKKFAVITNIDKDHTQILGDSLEKIAHAKAGIIQQGTTVICGETRPKLKKIFQDEAMKHDSLLFFVEKSTEEIVAHDLGAHQQHNALLAQRTLEEIGIDQEKIDFALKRTQPLPCRFEIMSRKPTLVLDGAHSPAKIDALVEQIKDQFETAHILFGGVTTKDVDLMIKKLLPIAKTISTTRFTTNFRKAANPFTLLKLVPKAKRGKAFLDHKEALKYVQSRVKKNDVIICTGSLYLTGEIRSSFISEEDILKARSSFPFDKRT